MTVNDLKPLEDRLDTIINLLAARCVNGKSLTDGAIFLERLGLDRKVAATLYGTTPGAVRACISEAKKRGRGKLGSLRKK